MKLPKNGTNQLPKEGFDWIILKFILKGPKGPKKVKLGYFATFWKLSQNMSDNFF